MDRFNHVRFGLGGVAARLAMVVVAAQGTDSP